MPLMSFSQGKGQAWASRPPSTVLLPRSKNPNYTNYLLRPTTVKIKTTKNFNHGSISMSGGVV